MKQWGAASGLAEGLFAMNLDTSPGLPGQL